mgnify:FL=1
MPTDISKIKKILEKFDQDKILEEIETKKDFESLVAVVYLIGQLVSNSDYKGERGDKGDIGKQGVQGPRGDKGEPGLPGTPGKDGQSIQGLPGLNGADGSPDTPEIIKLKLESLEDEDKLKIDAIKDLQEELDKLKKQVNQKVYVGGGAAEGGRIVRVEDISSSLNGSTKTFSLPAFWRVISVHSSSFPNAFRPTTDYTVDGSLMQITFTSEIDATSVLSTGQTVIVLYSTN